MKRKVKPMNDNQAVSIALSEPDVSRVEEQPRLAGGAPTVPVAQPAETESTDRRSGWTAGRLTVLVIGALQVLVALGLLGGGGTALWADRTQRDAGYVTTDVHKFSTPGSALATERTELGAAGWGWLYAPALLNKVRIRVTPTNPRSTLFVGIGRTRDVDRYLAGVSHTVIADFWNSEVTAVDGGAAGSAPGLQDFWVASDSGAGTRDLVWAPTDGSWTVVVMNADGRPGISVGADLGARLPAVPWIAAGLLAAGTVFLVGGALLITAAIRRRNTSRASTV
jgi:hypothetical protein